MTAVEQLNFHASGLGLLLLCGAIVISIVYMIVIVKVVDRYKPVTVTTYQNLIGLFYFIPLTLWLDHDTLPLLSFSPKMILLVAALGILCSTVAYVFYNYGIRKLGASTAATFINVSPVFAVSAALLIGQEPFSLLKILGVAVAITGVYIGQNGNVG